MRKFGFTLIELLAVMTILGILSLIATVAINKVIKDSSEKAYNLQIENIIDGARMWAGKNVFELPDEGSITLTLFFLKQNGLVEKDIVNPNTEELFEDNLLVIITKSGNGYKYEVVEEIEDKTLIGEFNEKAPLVALRGNLIERVATKEVGNYIDKGIIATDINGNEVTNIVTTITKNGNTYDTISLSETGTYLINYQVTNNGYTTSITRKVIVT